ncbi:two-component regulator propeller domain-containing protein [Paludibaculum fermentans]|uniref:hybrid sensor histidine kinase/response regulator n=1 Tax=Paludibaculum fermentans TaxID=1473598 RepID=UPI003EB92D61
MRALSISAGVLLLSTLAPTTLLAHQYQFLLYGRQHGLGNLAISAITQDQTGYLWVGTQNGLYRYDGHSFVEKGHSAGIPADPIVAVHADQQGGLWVATHARLYYSTPNGFREIQFGRKIQFLTHNVIDSRNGLVYAATSDGLIELSPNAAGNGWIVREIATGKTRQSFRAVRIDQSGAVWTACGSYICRSRAGQTTVYGESEGVPRDNWDSIALDGRGGLWVRSVAHLLHTPSAGARFEAESPGPPDASFHGELAPSADGTLLATTRRGLALKHHGQWHMVGIEEGLPASSTTAIFEDREGSIWIGTWGVGLCRWLGSSSVESWSSRDGLPHESVNAIARDPSQRVWVGTDTGLSSLRSGETSSPLRALADTKVRALQAAGNTLWVGLFPGGVASVDTRTLAVRRFGTADGLKDERVNGLLLDRSGQLWVCTMRGLFVRKQSGFVPALPDGPSDEVFLRVVEDPSGGVWVATSKGLRLWRDGVWRHYTSRDGLAQDAVTLVRAPSPNEVLVSYRGSKGFSILHLDGDRIRSVEHIRAPSLPSNHVLFLGHDTGGDIWVGTDNGVGLRRKRAWSTLAKADGLIWDDCNTNSFFADPEGGVWLGTSRGLTHILPGAKPRLTLGPPPSPVFSSLQFGGHQQAAHTNLEIPYSSRLLELGLACLTFRQEEHLHYRYRLSGLEDSWVETATPELRFPNLPPGRYRLEVFSLNAAGEASPSPALAQFVILPPWYGTWWFYAALLAAAALSIRQLIRWRTANLRRKSLELEAAVQARTEELQNQYDLADRQKTEIERLLDEANQLHRAKNEFLANISHEIRTPMNGILGLTELALHTHLDPEQLEYVEATRKSAQSLLGLLNDVLDFAKIEAERVEIETVPFSIAGCLDLARDTFASQSIAKGLEVQVDVPPSVPEQLLGDSRRVGQVVMNLVGNAVKFTQHGSITLSARVDSAIGDIVRLRVQVRDTGIGIPVEKQQLIFEPFRQADGSTARTYGGTGLGLSISARLVEIMGGRLTVESALGQGSVFSFTLPLKLAAFGGVAPSEAVAGSQPFAAGHSVRVLLAEDHQINQLVVIRLLQKRGHHVTAVNNGEEAVAAATAGAFDLILMDMQMPVMDGLQAAQLIRALPGPASRVPIVALTANALGAAQEECRAAGMDAYLAKPVTAEDLYHVVETVSAPRPDAVLL